MAFWFTFSPISDKITASRLNSAKDKKMLIASMWIFRAVCFAVRFKGHKWERKKMEDKA